MKPEKRIYCIEGHWDYGNKQVEPSVEPMLALLRGMGLWEYARRDCATAGELVYFLEAEWHRCRLLEGDDMSVGQMYLRRARHVWRRTVSSLNVPAQVIVHALEEHPVVC